MTRRRIASAAHVSGVASPKGDPCFARRRCIGADLVAKSPPDGYTIMVQSVTHVGNAHLYKKLPYDTLKDFAPVGMLTGQMAVLTVHPSLPVKTVKEFIALAKARPNEILYSTAGNGSIPHLSMALLGSMAGIQLVHVPQLAKPDTAVFCSSVHVCPDAWKARSSSVQSTVLEITLVTSG